jgi:drug/metabolite transporter (DMT)-like permease
MAFEKQAEKMKAKADAQQAKAKAVWGRALHGPNPSVNPPPVDDRPLTKKERSRWGKLFACGILITSLYLLWFLYDSNQSFHNHVQQNKDNPLWVIHGLAILLLSALSFAAWVDWRGMPKGQRREWKAGRYTRIGIALALDGLLIVAYAFYWAGRNIPLAAVAALIFITGDILYYKGAKLAKADPLGIRKKRK